MTDGVEWLLLGVVIKLFEILGLVSLKVVMSSPVENEMLEHKDGVKEDGCDAQDELDKVECTLLEKRLAKGN